MARTIQEIYDKIIENKNQQSELGDLTSTSVSAIYRVIYYTIATAINLHEQYFDLFKKDLEIIRDNTPIMTEKWWNDRMLNFFQFDSLDTNKTVLKISDSYVPYYETVDETSRIIKYCATKQSVSDYPVISIKVAKDNGLGSPIQLNEDELLAANSFANELQGCGLKLNVVSFPGDSYKINLDVYYNAQYGQTTVYNSVIDAINLYLSNLEFDGEFITLRFVDYLQNNVVGLKDLEILTQVGQAVGGQPIQFTRKYTTLAGYLEFDLDNSIINLIAV